MPSPSVADNNASAPTRRRPKRLAVAAIVAVVVVLAIMWVYAFFIADTSRADRLHDRAWAQQAERTCQPYAAQIAALPPARDFADIQPKSEALARRAVVVDQVTDLLTRMVADLRRTTPNGDTDRRLVADWLADYDAYLAARRTQTAAWRAGDDPRFAVPEAGGAPIDSRMDDLTDANAMPSCTTPGDLA